MPSRTTVKPCRTENPGGARAQRGFTFLEIMIVVTIMGILASIIGVKLHSNMLKALDKATRVQMSSIKEALGHYATNVGDYPTTEQGLEALVKRPSDVAEDVWDQCMEEMPVDAWKHPFTYRCPGEHDKPFDLVSKGKDGKEGTEDDITNYASGAKNP
jgi:general secretion pathway protein G